MMATANCKHFGACGVPLCPLEKQGRDYIWYPDEAICRHRGFRSLPWIQRQRLIAKKHGSFKGFFTIEMLNAIKRVSKGIVGADSNAPFEKRADLKWIEDLRKKRKEKAHHKPLKKEGNTSTSKLRKNQTTPRGIGISDAL